MSTFPDAMTDIAVDQACQKPLFLPLMQGYKLLEADQYKRYTLLDAEAKIQNPALMALEIDINRKSTQETLPIQYLPVTAQWPLVSDDALPGLIDEQICLAREASFKLRRIPLKTRIEVLQVFGRKLRQDYKLWRSLTIQEGYSHNAFLASLDAILETFKPAYFDMIQSVLEPNYKQGSRARIEHVPQGVLGVISPQNSSFPMLTQILHGAFLSGNAVLIKPPHRMAIVALKLVEVFNQVLKENGMPDGLVSSIVHPRTPKVLAHWLEGQNRIDNLIFIGNSKRRDYIIQTCQKAGISNPIVELEGVDAAYVHNDLDNDQLQAAAKAIAFAKNAAAGQFCVSLRRLYVHPDIHGRLMTYLKQEFARYQPGPLRGEDPFILGPSSMAPRLPNILKQFLQEGATVAQGGRRLDCLGAEDEEGIYVEPTLLDQVPPHSELLKAEIFANVLPVVQTDGTTTQAIDLMNSCDFALRASIFAQDVDVLTTMRHHLKVGTVVVNGNPLDFSIQIAGGRGLSTTDQHARIWPIDLSLRQVVTEGGQVKSLTEVLSDYDQADRKELSELKLLSKAALGDRLDATHKQLVEVANGG